MTGQLIVSVSGIGERSLPDVDGLCAQLDARGVPVSLLVAPRLHGAHRLDRDPETVRWLASRRRGGDAIVLHGYDETATRGRRGEFATLPAHEARLRLVGADRVLEHLGLRTRLFAAPGWLVSPGTVAALPRTGFRLLAGQGGIVDLVRGDTVPARVLGIPGPGLLTDWWCRSLLSSAERVARRGGVVRIGVTAVQLRRPAALRAVLDSVDVALRLGCTPGVYRWRAEPLVFDAA